MGQIIKAWLTRQPPRPTHPEVNMKISQRHLTLTLCCWRTAASTLVAAQEAKPDDLIAAQRKALEPLQMLDGLWRGSAKVVRPDGKEAEITQTERSGSLLSGSIRLIEGRGYGADGT